MTITDDIRRRLADVDQLREDSPSDRAARPPAQSPGERPTEMVRPRMPGWRFFARPYQAHAAPASRKRMLSGRERSAVAVRSFKFRAGDGRSPEPELWSVEAATDARARAIAEQILLRSSTYQAIEVWEDGRLLFVVRADQPS